MTERDDNRPMADDMTTRDDMTMRDDMTGETADERIARERRLHETRRDEMAAAPAGTPERPRSWDREEWEGQNQTRKVDPDLRGTVDEAVTGAPRWNEGEVVGEGQGGPDEGPTRNVEPTEGDSELGGHGHNPGGGERWGDVDRS